MTIAELTTFFGWMSIINIGVLFFYLLVVTTCRGCIQKIHSKLLGVSEDILPPIYMKFLGHYKILVIFFNIVPYFTLKIMT